MAGRRTETARRDHRGATPPGAPASAPGGAGEGERRARPSRPEFALSAVLFGGASPTFHAAHSLDKAQVGVDLPYCHELGEAQADVLTTTGSSTLTTQTGRCPLDPTVRVGLGAGHSLAVAPWEVRWSYAALDERRHDSGFSLSFTVEGGWRSLGIGAAASRTVLLDDVGLRPGIGVAFAHATRDMQAEPEYLSPTETNDEIDGGTDGLVTRYGSNDILVPVGLDVPMRLADKLALVPFVGVTAVVPLVKWVDTVSCDNCLIGLEGYDMGVSMQLWAGVRIEPWMVPARYAGRDSAPSSASRQAPAAVAPGPAAAEPAPVVEPAPASPPPPPPVPDPVASPPEPTPAPEPSP